MSPKPVIARAVWIGVVFLTVIGIAIVIRRIVALTPAVPDRGALGLAALDASFEQRRLLTLLHILPGLAFVSVGPFQFISTLRKRRPTLHRRMGRVFLGSGFIVGSTAVVMSPQIAIGGATESAATMLFGGLFLFALIKAFAAIRRRRTALHREWMIRAYAIGLAVSTIRPIVGIFFATRSVTHLTPQDFFGFAFWAGFTAHLVAAEIWINRTRPRARSKHEPKPGPVVFSRSR